MDSYKELLDFGKEYLREKKIENGDLDAWLLMEYVCKISRTWYLPRLSHRGNQYLQHFSHPDRKKKRSRVS